MEPFYFGTGEKRLFGIHHAPANGARRRQAVVLCYPMGHEYFRVHRTFRQLSARLAEAGFHALRFDYYGCGDSAGESEEGAVEQWLEDIGAAVDEIKDLSGAAEVTLIGARLGATLAALVARRRREVDGLALWDPIVKGEDYVRELTRRQKDWLRDGLPEPRRFDRDDPMTEALGFPLPDRLRRGLEKIDLQSPAEWIARRMFVVESLQLPVHPLWSKRAQGFPPEVECERLAGPMWRKGMKRKRRDPLVPLRIVEAIVAWIARAPS
jgi:alpha-beta hydrolase superfamily lysophospholipase